MPKFYVTFCQKYRHEDHPRLGFDPQLPDRVMVIDAEDINAACRRAFEILGQHFSSVYSESDIDLESYPRGEFVAPPEYKHKGEEE